MLQKAAYCFAAVSYIRTFLQELRVIAGRGGSSAHVAVLFTIIVGTSLFVLPSECASKVIPCFLWACSVSVMQISIRALFEEDYNSGLLEQLLIQDLLPEVLVFLKVMAHWVCVAVPICAIAAAIDFVVLGESFSSALYMGAALSMALLIINFVSSVGHALVLGSERGLVMAQVLIFPVVVPIAVYFNMLLMPERSVAFGAYSVGLLGAGMLSLIPISIFFIISSIKLAVEQN